MISELLNIILVEIIILYIGIRILYNYYKEDQIDKEKRMLELEKRVGKLERGKKTWKHIVH